MRILVVRPGPFYSVADVANGWVKGLDAYADVVDLNYDDRLLFFDQSLKLAPDYESLPVIDRAARVVQLASHDIRADVYDIWPDVIVVVSGFFLPPEWYDIVRSRGHKIVMLLTESPYEDDLQLARAPYADICVLNDPTNLDRFLEVNPNTVYLPHCYDPEVHFPGPPEPELEADFTFVGTAYKSRVEFFESVDWAGLDVKLAGNWELLGSDSPLLPYLVDGPDNCMNNVDAARYYRSCKVSANVYRKEASLPSLEGGWAMGPREVELAACGAFFIREARGEGDDIFPFHPTFVGPDDFGELVRYYVSHNDERAALADKARAAIADRTFEHNARRLLALIDKET